MAVLFYRAALRRVFSVPLANVSFSFLLMGMAPKAISQSTSNTITSASYLGQVVLGLGLIVLLILGLAWLAKRLPQFSRINNNSVIAIRHQTALGLKEKLVIAEVGGKQLVLGVTPQSISLLHTFDEGEAIADKVVESTIPTQQGPVTFQQIFSKFNKRDPRL